MNSIDNIMKAINLRLRTCITGLIGSALFVILSGCGGGAGGTGSGESNAGTVATTNPVLTSTVAFGPAVSIHLTEVIPARVAPGTSLTLKVMVTDASGNTLDATDQVTTEVDIPTRLKTTFSSSGLKLEFSREFGPVTLRVRTMGLLFEKRTYLTGLVSDNVSKIMLSVGEGYSPLTSDADGAFSLLPGRDLLLYTRAILFDGETELNSEVQITSSNPSVVSVHPSKDVYGNVIWWVGNTRSTGVATLTVRWAEFEVTQVIRVRAGLMLRAQSTSHFGMTENDAGRSTVFFSWRDENAPQRLAFVESRGENQWGSPVILPTLDSPLHTVWWATAAEAGNGHRAVLAINSLSPSQQFVYLISPTGAIVGPVVVPADGYVLRIVVTTDGNAHLWSKSGNQVIRKIVRYSDTSVSTVNSVTVTSATFYHFPQVAAAKDGTVAVTWTDDDCRIHYAFDKLQNLGSIPSDSIGAVNVAECGSYFSDIFTHHRAAVGGDELGLIVQYGASTGRINTQIVLAKRGGTATSSLVDRDVGMVAGAPAIDMTTSGEFVAMWATENLGAESRGVLAVHRASGAAPGAPFVVEPAYFSLGTSYVEGVYSRGDGRFVLVWPGGPERTPLVLRNFSATTGLGPRLSFPYQNSTATNSTSFLASPRGISAVWSFAPDLDVDEMDAIQNFLP